MTSTFIHCILWNGSNWLTDHTDLKISTDCFSGISELNAECKVHSAGLEWPYGKAILDSVGGKLHEWCVFIIKCECDGITTETYCEILCPALALDTHL